MFALNSHAVDHATSAIAPLPPCDDNISESAYPVLENGPLNECLVTANSIPDNSVSGQKKANKSPAVQSFFSSLPLPLLTSFSQFIYSSVFNKKCKV
ncbi:hypothetical protein AVEN_10395-1 [Araneus ventricosus]|uniref:Uncharacterized protein n=1 Tax=Araneus ventricosus TaxID=182803 RepID=A0A4Y2AUJ7_ARAVE|nr:hypothetical protein AVEN_10395-1 [Araneus ventricosus]